MALPYKIVTSDNKFIIRELPTEQDILMYENKVDAKKHCKILNLGGAFDGFTPRFMIEQKQ